MEDALAQADKASKCRHLSRVLILVLMEDALAHNWILGAKVKDYCLNPCFNGRCTRTESKQLKNVEGCVES